MNRSPFVESLKSNGLMFLTLVLINQLHFHFITARLKETVMNRSPFVESLNDLMLLTLFNFDVQFVDLTN